MSSFRDTNYRVMEGDTVVYKGSEDECKGYVLLMYFPQQAKHLNVTVVKHGQGILTKLEKKRLLEQLQSDNSCSDKLKDFEP